jgi:hypothetical protein
MVRRATFAALLTTALASAAAVFAQSTPLERLPRHLFDAAPPTARVAGDPGQMAFRTAPCRTLPLAAARQQIVDLAVQEWAYFGFPIVEYTAEEDDDPPGPRRRGRGRLGGPEAARVAASIAGYWAVAPGGAWILDRQNEMWRESEDEGVTRWRFPWSAAFISWVMCEGGLGTADRFQRAIAHHTYIDQAIRARDGARPGTAYVAYDAGEAAIAPGDMLCTSRRPVFRTLADRRRQLGQGARSHCDLVVKVDEAARQILAIGGNVRGAVGLKVVPAVRTPDGLRPAGGSNARPVFAHLRLRGTAASSDAFSRSPTLQALACRGVPLPVGPTPSALRDLVASAGSHCDRGQAALHPPHTLGANLSQHD